jgi:hypothetical protein
MCWSREHDCALSCLVLPDIQTGLNCDDVIKEILIDARPPASPPASTPVSGDGPDVSSQQLPNHRRVAEADLNAGIALPPPAQPHNLNIAPPPRSPAPSPPPTRLPGKMHIRFAPPSPPPRPPSPSSVDQSFRPPPLVTDPHLTSSSSSVLGPQRSSGDGDASSVTSGSSGSGGGHFVSLALATNFGVDIIRNLVSYLLYALSLCLNRSWSRSKSTQTH